MPASYPLSLKVFQTYQDYVDFDLAAHTNELHDEIYALEAAVGPNPGNLHDPSHTPGSVGAQLDSLDLAKAAANHVHNTSPAGVLLGGSAGGLAVSVTGTQIQALNNGVPSPLFLQYSGSDLRIGSGNCQVTVYGGLATSGGGITAPSVAATNVTASSTVTTSLLNVTGAALFSGLVSVAGEIDAAYILTPNIALSSGGTFTLKESGDTIHAHNSTVLPYPGWNAGFAGDGTTGFATMVLDGDPAKSIKYISGQVVGRKDRAFNTDSWNQANFIAERVGDVAATFAVYLPTGLPGNLPGAYCFHANVTQPTLGWKFMDSRNGFMEGNAGYVPVTSAGFVTVSAAESKTEIAPHVHGLKTLSQLNPVEYYRSGIQLSTLPGATPVRPDLKSHGLLAEEVHDILPEVVAHDEEGKPVGIEYSALIPTLINSIKELKTLVDGLAADNAALRAQVREHWTQ